MLRTGSIVDRPFSSGEREMRGKGKGRREGEEGHLLHVMQAGWDILQGHAMQCGRRIATARSTSIYREFKAVIEHLTMCANVNLTDKNKTKQNKTGQL